MRVTTTVASIPSRLSIFSTTVEPKVRVWNASVQEVFQEALSPDSRRTERTQPRCSASRTRLSAERAARLASANSALAAARAPSIAEVARSRTNPCAVFPYARLSFSLSLSAALGFLGSCWLRDGITPLAREMRVLERLSERSLSLSLFLSRGGRARARSWLSVGGFCAYSDKNFSRVRFFAYVNSARNALIESRNVTIYDRTDSRIWFKLVAWKWVLNHNNFHRTCYSLQFQRDI